MGKRGRSFPAEGFEAVGGYGGHVDDGDVLGGSELVVDVAEAHVAFYMSILQICGWLGEEDGVAFWRGCRRCTCGYTSRRCAINYFDFLFLVVSTEMDQFKSISSSQ